MKPFACVHVFGFLYTGSFRLFLLSRSLDHYSPMLIMLWFAQKHRQPEPLPTFFLQKTQKMQKKTKKNKQNPNVGNAWIFSYLIVSRYFGIALSIPKPLLISCSSPSQNISNRFLLESEHAYLASVRQG